MRQTRDEGRRLAGRVIALDAATRHIVVQTRGGDAGETVNVDASSVARFLRFAPDSARTADAAPGSFSDLKIGDLLRATGERGTDTSQFKADEIISGSFARVVGNISAVDTSRGVVSVKNTQTGQTFEVLVGRRTTLRRVTPEFERAVTERVERASQRAQQRASGQAGQTQAGGVARSGETDGQRRGTGLQQMFESLPAVTVADLRKGDAVVATVTQGADSSRVTAVTLVTGGAEFLRRLQELQRGSDGARGMSPGLPGDVIGNGTGGNQQQQQTPPQ